MQRNSGINSTQNSVASWILSLLAVTGVVVVLNALGSQLAPISAKEESDNKVLRHVVQFAFKSDASKVDVSKVIEAFRQLPGKIGEISEFEFGDNNSPEDLAHGYTHCFIVTFRSEKDRDTYLTHKAHLEFVTIVKPVLEKAQVIDFWAHK